MAISFLPERGERALIIGQSGSGKTAMVAWMMRRIDRAPIVIYDTKDENKFLTLKPNIVVSTFSDVIAAVNSGTFDYIIVRPHVSLLADPEALDEFLYMHFMMLHGIDAYVDELYTFHNNGRYYKGLAAMLTRGRSKGITTIMATQRPCMISKFAITESQKRYIFYLDYRPDIKRVAEFVPDYDELRPIPWGSHKFYYYNLATARVLLFNKVQLDKDLDTGYVDKEAVEQPDAERSRRRLWS